MRAFVCYCVFITKLSFEHLFFTLGSFGRSIASLTAKGGFAFVSSVGLAFVVFVSTKVGKTVCVVIFIGRLR